MARASPAWGNPECVLALFFGASLSPGPFFLRTEPVRWIYKKLTMLHFLFYTRIWIYEELTMPHFAFYALLWIYERLTMPHCVIYSVCYT